MSNDDEKLPEIEHRGAKLTIVLNDDIFNQHTEVSMQIELQYINPKELKKTTIGKIIDRVVKAVDPDNDGGPNNYVGVGAGKTFSEARKEAEADRDRKKEAVKEAREFINSILQNPNGNGNGSSTH